MHQPTYHRLCEQEREGNQSRIAAEETYAQIARRIGRSTSTISREVNTHPTKTGYRVHSAMRRSLEASTSRRLGKSHLALRPALLAYVITGLKKHWSPREIVKRMKQEYPTDMDMRISHESIYQYIYILPRGELKKILISALRQERAYRRTQRKSSTPEEKRGKIADMLSIEERPKEIEDRVVPGHWEGDLIVGKYKRSAVGTLVERTTRYTILVPLKKKDAQSVRKAYAHEFKKLPKEIAKTLTYDQGKEMSEHHKFTTSTGIQVYFAHPGSPWERGTNENTNGLIRQYFPKGTEFNKISIQEIKRVQRELNDRPRAVLDYLKPDEVTTCCVKVETKNKS